MPIHFDDPVMRYLDADGQWHEFPKEIGPITIDNPDASLQATGGCELHADANYIVGVDLARGESFTATLKWSVPRISRKQFCRKLVKMGYPEKKAKSLARAIRCNYAKALAIIRITGESYADHLMGGGA